MLITLLVFQARIFGASVYGGFHSSQRRSTNAKDKPYVCSQPGCKSAFFYQHHLLRHETQKHGRTPAKARNSLYDMLIATHMEPGYSHSSTLVVEPNSSSNSSLAGANQGALAFESHDDEHNQTEKLILMS